MGGTGRGSTYVSKLVSWADETDDLEGGNSNDEDVYRAPPIDRSILLTASRAAREPNINWSYLPKLLPYIAFLGNLPYDVTEESIKEFFRGLNISAVFGYAEFEDLDSLFSALSLNEESLGNKIIRVDIANQAQDKDRGDRSFGCDRNWDCDKTDTDWRARPATDSFGDYSPRRGDDNRYDSDQYRNKYQEGPPRDMDRYGGRDRCDDQGGRDYDRGYDSQIGNGRKAFGSGQDDWSWSSRDDYPRDDYRRDDRGPPQRSKLNLKPWSTPKGDDSSTSTSQFSRAPTDTAAREREVEEWLQKEQEKLQRQLDEPKLERWLRQRHPSWRSEEIQEQEQLRTGSESSQTGTSVTSSRNKFLENETLNKQEDCHSPASKPSKPDQPLKVMPARPPKENTWVKHRAAIPTNVGGKVAPAQLSEERMKQSRWDECPKSQTGNSSHGPGDRGNKDHWMESDTKDGKKDQESRSVPEPKKSEENPASKFSSASKYATVSIDGENENKREDNAE
uniref:RRM domain-containing protein n=1 Tax=Mandrillus leucophaeus TaxID=9568 RepID=A0A2K5XR63_MANLE